MEPQSDYSYGVIPFFKEEGTWKVFLINQYGYSGDVYWTLPKGHAEAEETPIQAALRELYEETGITLTQLDDSKTYTQEYSFTSNGEVIHKTVVYFKGFAQTQDFSIQADEVKEAGWYDCDVAVSQLSFDGARVLLQEAIADLPK